MWCSFLLRRAVLKFWFDRRAGIAMLFGITAPVLLLLIAGAVEVTEVVKARRELQWDVDTAALNAAGELGADQSNATATRAQSLAASLAAQSTSRWAVVTSAKLDAPNGAVTVDQAASRASMFGSLLPPGGWHIHVTSTAITNAKTPLCVLGIQSTAVQAVSLQNTSKLMATGCLVQSNADIKVSSSASMQAGMVRSVGAAQGPISPLAITDAPKIEDPFASLVISAPSLCTDYGVIISNGSQSLNPGVHCGNIWLQGSATLTLNPGEHYFVGSQFNINGAAQLVGTDIVLILTGSTTFQIGSSASLSFIGRKSGPYAGFIIISERNFTSTLVLSTTNARNLQGTIYLPNTSLSVLGTDNKVADQSPWTVIVAKTITTSGSANLVINSNYANSSVPVPQGVGNMGGGSPHLSN